MGGNKAGAGTTGSVWRVPKGKNMGAGLVGKGKGASEGMSRNMGAGASPSGRNKEVGAGKAPAETGGTASASTGD